jgi:quinol monooxygenase YgiN
LQCSGSAMEFPGRPSHLSRRPEPRVRTEEVGMATFVQLIEMETADVGPVNDLIKGWHEQQGGVAPGYRSTRVLVDRDRADTYVIEVEFSSEEDGAKNNERPETSQWAASLRELVNSEPRYINLTESYDTGR